MKSDCRSVAAVLVGLVLICPPVGSAPSQTPPPAVIYSLLTGSSLTDDCLPCDRLSLPVPIAGTFRLVQTGGNPLVTTYALGNISFQTAITSGPPYQVTGTGTYQIGGEVALVQGMTLTLQIDNGFTNELCYFTNASTTVTSSWPRIEISLDQTNGTLVHLYRLHLVAAPATIQFSGITTDPTSSGIRLEWQAGGAKVQLERAMTVNGPYAVLATNLTVQSFVDRGVLTNQSRLYYRLRLE